MRRSVMFLSAILLLAVGGTAGYTYGKHQSDDANRALQTALAQSRDKESQLQSQYDSEHSTNDQLRDDLKKAKSALDDIFQSTKTITLTANMSERLSIGRLTIGLANGLGSDSVSVNINGKPQNMASGGMANLAFTFNCMIELESFDVKSSSATFNTSCSPTAK